MLGKFQSENHDLIQSPTRRRILGGLAGAAGAMVLGNPALSAVLHSSVRRLRLNHAMTGENLWVTYYIEGEYVDEALVEIEYLLRDYSGRKGPSIGNWWI